MRSHTPYGGRGDRRVTLSRVRAAFLVSLALSIVLITQVTVGFHPVRVKLVRSPAAASDGVAQADTSREAGAAALNTPFAVIARIRNDAARAARFDIKADGRAICSADVQASTERRIDCAVTDPWDTSARHTIAVTGERGVAWTLAYLEIATHHGSTRGFDVIVVPSAAVRQERPGLSSVVLCFLLLAAVLILPPATMPAWLRRFHAGVSLFVGAVMLVVVLSPRVSAYSVLLSARAFAEMTLVLVAPRLWAAGEWVWKRATSTWRRVLACAAVGVLVLAAYGAVVGQFLRDNYGGNYSGFIQLSRHLFDQHPTLSSRDDVRRSLVLHDGGGYDGQFMYYMTFDPFLRMYRNNPATYGRFIDAPPYRFGRMGFSMLTRLFSAGQWTWYPRTMMWLILASLFACGFALAWQAQLANAGAAWGLLILIVPGFWQSLQTALPEPVAAALLLAAILFLRKGYAVAAGVLFAASLLIRETGAIMAVASATTVFLSGRRRDAARLFLISLMPLLLWRLYVGWTLFPEWGMKAFFFNAQNVGVPFLGIADLWIRIREGTYFPDAPLIARAGILYPMLLGFGLAVALMTAMKRPSPLVVAAVLYGLMAVSLTYDSIWVHIGNGQRGTYELFIALALVSLETRGAGRLITWSLATFWSAVALYVFVGAYDADLIRNAIL